MKTKTLFGKALGSTAMVDPLPQLRRTPPPLAPTPNQTLNSPPPLTIVQHQQISSPYPNYPPNPPLPPLLTIIQLQQIINPYPRLRQSPLRRRMLPLCVGPNHLEVPLSPPSLLIASEFLPSRGVLLNLTKVQGEVSPRNLDAGKGIPMYPQ